MKILKHFRTIKESANIKDTNIIFIRHAQSAFNKGCIDGAQELRINHLGWDTQMKNKYFSENVAFNPKYIDCSITQQGIIKSKKTAQQMKSRDIDIVLVSPKLRALQTCSYIFPNPKVPVIVQTLLAQSCRFSCDGIKKETLKKKIKNFPNFDFSKVKQQRVAYNIRQSMIQYYDKQIINKNIKTQQQKQALLAKMISTKQIYEDDKQLRERAWKIKQLLLQYSKKYSNICVVSHWYTLSAVLSKQFTAQSQNIGFFDSQNCKPYYYKLSELLKVK